MATQTKKTVDSSSNKVEAPETGMFGITSDVRSQSTVPFQPTAEQPITLGYLVDVKADTRELKDGKGTKAVLLFYFKDMGKVRSYTHTEWELDPHGEKADKFTENLTNMQARIKHIYEAFAQFPDTPLGSTAKNFTEFFEQVAEAFNTNGKEGKPIYEGTKIWIKVVYGIKGGAKAQLGFPLFPNFVERYKEGHKTTLWINNKYETIEQPKRAGNAAKLVEFPGASIDGDSPFPEFKS